MTNTMPTTPTDFDLIVDEIAAVHDEIGSTHDEIINLHLLVERLAIGLDVDLHDVRLASAGATEAIATAVGCSSGRGCIGDAIADVHEEVMSLHSLVERLAIGLGVDLDSVVLPVEQLRALDAR